MKSKSEIDAIVDRWCDALESGAYEQGKGYLHSEGCFCCLGVLCDLLKADLGIDVTKDGSTFCYDGVNDALPANVRNALGITSTGLFGRMIDIGKVTAAANLAEANDAGATFAEIAPAIRANRHLLFKAYREGASQ